jgi:hypothetical protein
MLKFISVCSGIISFSDRDNVSQKYDQFIEYDLKQLLLSGVITSEKSASIEGSYNSYRKGNPGLSDSLKTVARLIYPVTSSLE